MNRTPIHSLSRSNMRSVIFFLHSCTFYINCKRDRLLRIVLYSGKLHLLIFEKFPFEKMIVICNMWISIRKPSSENLCDLLISNCYHNWIVWIKLLLYSRLVTKRKRSDLIILSKSVYSVFPFEIPKCETKELVHFAPYAVSIGLIVHLLEFFVI